MSKNVETANVAQNAKATAAELATLAATYQPIDAPSTASNANEEAALALYEEQAPSAAPLDVSQASAQLAALAKALGLDLAATVAPSLAPAARQAIGDVRAPKALRAGLVAQPNEAIRIRLDQILTRNITAVIGYNPKNPSGASYYRFEGYFSLALPCKVSEALKATSLMGGDILWDIRKGFIKVEGVN